MRVDHEKKSAGVRVDHEKMSDGVRIDHEKKGDRGKRFTIGKSDRVRVYYER